MSDFVGLKVIDGRYAVVKLPPGSELTNAPSGVEFWSQTVTRDEVSLVCPEASVPVGPDLSVERTWRCLKVFGPLEFELKGILAGLLGPLSDAGVSVFALSTYGADYIFVKEKSLNAAVAALSAAGHAVC